MFSAQFLYQQTHCEKQTQQAGKKQVYRSLINNFT